MTPTRRHFLGAFAAAATMKVASAYGRYLRKIGLQLLTVRDLLSSDFEGTLREIARLGYQEVEFADVLGPNLKQTRNGNWVLALHRCTSTTIACANVQVRHSRRRRHLQQSL